VNDFNVNDTYELNLTTITSLTKIAIFITSHFENALNKCQRTIT